MKKTTALLLSLLFLVPLTACSGTRNKTESSEPDNPVELVLATDSSFSQLGAMVNSFNKSHENYKIKVRRYGDSAETTIDLLRTEIIAGQAPDIYVLSQDWFSDVQIPIYEDLLPLLDADVDYGRDIFVPSLFDAILKDGSLYCLPTDFYINTFAAPESIVGDRTHITLDEAEELAKALGEDVLVFPPWMSREVMLTYSYNFALAKLMDTDSSFNFLDPEFIGLLEMCSSLPSDPNKNSEASGLDAAYLERPSLLRNFIYQNFEAVRGLHYSNGTDYSFVGFPTDDGSGNSFGINVRLYISSSSKHKDAAWEFVRMVLSDEVQDSVDFLPVTQSALDRRIEKALNGNPELGEVRLEQREIDKFNALLAATKTLNAESDSVIFTIVRDEAAKFFTGDCTAREAAEIIQSRVSIYVAEQR